MYKPGVRNINESERTVRRNIGYIGVSFSIVLIIILYLVSAPPLMGLAMYLPVWVAAFGFLQSKNEFCVMHASIGVHYAYDGQETLIEIEEESHRITDRKKARRLQVYAVLIGMLGALIGIALLLIAS